jgi:hypothetical protein
MSSQGEGPQPLAIPNDERQDVHRIRNVARGPADTHLPSRPNKQRRASTCRVMTMAPNSDALSAAAPCKSSAWSPVFRAYLPEYDVTLLGAQHVSSSPSKRSRSNRNHNPNL